MMPDCMLFETVLCRLTPPQRDLFHRHCFQGETLLHIAAATGQPPASVRQSFCLLRRHLQSLLMQEGLSARQARDYLYTVLTAHPGKPSIPSSN